MSVQLPFAMVAGSRNPDPLFRPFPGTPALRLACCHSRHVGEINGRCNRGVHCVVAFPGVDKEEGAPGNEVILFRTEARN